MLHNNIRLYPSTKAAGADVNTRPIALINNFMLFNSFDNTNSAARKIESQQTGGNTTKPPISPHSKLTRSPKRSYLALAGLSLFHPDDPRISSSKPTYDPELNAANCSESIRPLKN